ncbi:HAMP domain-containing sensor histidine kinase [Burkholderia sp. BCC1999]|uniref:sensor histidine kinase n=1 Tax=Burkholderia sp. BCC1999 TaxID=2817448 RepID=UPI002AC36460|nr:HAMP domain-containing sensor histidine kinase [Burkholderia sp. BCC1999]
MTLPARPGRHIGQTIGLGATVAVLTACTVAFLLDVLRHPVVLPHDAPAGAMIRNASTYLVLATVLFVCLLAAAFDLLRQMRRTLAALDAIADNTGRIAAGDMSVRVVSRDGCTADLSRFIEDFNAMTFQLKHRTPSRPATAAGSSSRSMRTPLAELESRLEAIKALANETGTSSRDALLHQVDGLFRFVDDLQVAEQPEALILDLRSTALDREIASAIDSVREAFREAGFAIDLTTAATVVTCDGARIRQAVLALLDDMRRHSAPARLKLFVEDRPAGAVVRIEDEGSRRFVENGLGLSVVRAVVQAHGGQIRQLASLGGDAVLEFDIPRHAPAIRAFPR